MGKLGELTSILTKAELFSEPNMITLSILQHNHN